jgi:hypothetical protein
MVLGFGPRIVKGLIEVQIIVVYDLILGQDP